MNKNDKKMIASIILNFIIVALVICATIMMFTGFKFMHGKEPNVETSSIGMFRFFTPDSNIFMGIIALLFAIKEIMILKTKRGNISTKLYLLKFIATSGVGMTLTVVFVYLGPIADGGYSAMLQNCNLFFHLIIPVLSMITFMFLEKTDKLKFKFTFYGMIPVIIYSILYLINFLIHIENGQVSPVYDWYYFVQFGLWTIVIVIPIVYAISYLVSFLIWKINKIGVRK